MLSKRLLCFALIPLLLPITLEIASASGNSTESPQAIVQKIEALFKKYREAGLSQEKRKAALANQKQLVLEGANLGNPTAQFLLGKMYHEGWDVEKDAAQAVAWYRKAAEQGNPLGQGNLGSMYANGEGVEKDPAQAVAWYRKAAEQGEPIAQTQLGLSLIVVEGWEGLQKDSVEAILWFSKAAEQEHAPAQYLLGLMYEKGYSLRGYHGVGGEDIDQAVAWYRKAADQEYAPAQYSLGLMYERGHGVKRDEIQAAAWYRKAAEQGDTRAQKRLAGLILYDDVKADPSQGSRIPKALPADSSGGDNLAENRAQGIAWFRKSADQGDIEAQNRLGDIYMEGYFVKKDPVQAAYWYRKAAEQGDSGAQRKLGSMYERGEGVERDPAQAVAWYRKASGQSAPATQANLNLQPQPTPNPQPQTRDSQNLQSAQDDMERKSEEIIKSTAAKVSDPGAGSEGPSTLDIIRGVLKGGQDNFIGSTAVVMENMFLGMGNNAPEIREIKRGEVLTSLISENIPAGTTIYPIRVVYSSQLGTLNDDYYFYQDEFGDWASVKKE